MADDAGLNAVDDELIARLLSEDQAQVGVFGDADDGYESAASSDARRKRKKRKRGDLLVQPVTHLAKGQSYARVDFYHVV